MSRNAITGKAVDNFCGKIPNCNALRIVTLNSRKKCSRRKCVSFTIIYVFLNRPIYAWSMCKHNGMYVRKSSLNHWKHHRYCRLSTIGYKWNFFLKNKIKGKNIELCVRAECEYIVVGNTKSVHTTEMITHNSLLLIFFFR